MSRELSALARVEVPQAAKERGWALVQRELERHPLRAAGKLAGTPAGGKDSLRRAPARPALSARWRWAIGSAAAAIAVIAAVLGANSAGLFQTTVDNGANPTTLTSVVSSDTSEPPSTEPSTTVPTSGTTVSTTGANDTTTTAPGPSTTGEGTSTTVTPATSGSTSTSGGPGTTGTSTTKPTSTPTTKEQANVAVEREEKAEAAVWHLADLVVSGNNSGARALVAPEGQSSLVWFINSLQQPYMFSGIKALSQSGNIVRVSLAINDRVSNGQGELVETIKHFFITVRVDSEGAVVTAINAGS